MDLIKDLLGNNPSPSSLVDKGIDPAKHQKIVVTLCEKRKTLEAATSDKTNPNLEENVTALMQLKNDMQVFGISEIDYHAYLARNENPTNSEVRKEPEETIASKITTETLDNSG